MNSAPPSPIAGSNASPSAVVVPEKPKNVPLMVGGGLGVLAVLGVLAMVLGGHSQNTEASVAVASAAGAVSVPKIYLINGDMTEHEDGVPKGWKVMWSDVGKCKNVWDNTTFLSAPASLRVETSTPNSNNVGGQVIDLVTNNSQGSQEVTKASITLRVSGQYKSDGHSEVSVAVQSVKNWKTFGWQELAPVTKSASWTPFSKMVTLPAAIQQFQIILAIHGKGQGWLDDVKVEQSG